MAGVGPKKGLLETMHKLHSIPKPYSAQLSTKYSGVEVTFQGDAVLLLPLNSDYAGIVRAMNGAFMMGVLHERG